MNDGRRVPSVNEATEKTAPAGAVDQIGHALARIVHALAELSVDEVAFMEKWDIKDGFWREDNETGDEWNFCCLPPR